MNRILSVCAFAAVFMTAEKMPAQELQNLSLETAVTLARENTPTPLTYALEQQINTARLVDMRQRRGIKLSATADAQANPFLPASIIPVGQFNLQNPTGETRAIRFGTWWQASVGLTASVALIDAATGAQLREQGFQIRLTTNDWQATDAKAVSDVIRAYYDLLLTEAEIRFLEHNLKSAGAFLTEAQQRRAGGAALPADVNMAQLQVNDAQLRLEQARENRRLALENLLFRMGLPAERAGELHLGKSLEEILAKTETTANERFDSTGAGQNRADLQRLDLDDQLQNLKVATEKARLKPTLDANAYLGMNNFSDEAPLFAENSWFSNGHVTLRLNVPLSEHWELKKRTQPLLLKQQQNAVRREALHRQARHEFESALSAFSLAKRQLPIRRNDIELAASNLELARARYTGGNGLASEITDAEAVLQQKQYAWLQTAYNLLLAELDMRLARGEVR